MNIGAAIVVFVMIWWCVFFAVLPLGVRRGSETPRRDEAPVPGADPGAPADPQLKKKAWLTTRITLVLWLIVSAIILSGVFNFRD